jgi:hypothetical protein
LKIPDDQYFAVAEEYTQLKDKLYWQDGVALTADDVIYTIKTIHENFNRLGEVDIFFSFCPCSTLKKFFNFLGES